MRKPGILFVGALSLAGLSFVPHGIRPDRSGAIDPPSRLEAKPASTSRSCFPGGTILRTRTDSGSSAASRAALSSESVAPGGARPGAGGGSTSMRVFLPPPNTNTMSAPTTPPANLPFPLPARPRLRPRKSTARSRASRATSRTTSSSPSASIRRTPRPSTWARRPTACSRPPTAGRRGA